MNNIARMTVLAMGILLLLLGFGNIWDDSRVLVYDLTAICAGVGFIAVTRLK
jgi:hypothetical protein